jgi:hypothetical protein
MSEYGTGRKIGVGFNYPRVLSRRPMPLHKWYDFARHMARLKRNAGIPRWGGQLAPSAVEYMRLCNQDERSIR